MFVRDSWHSVSWTISDSSRLRSSSSFWVIRVTDGGGYGSCGLRVLRRRQLPRPERAPGNSSRGLPAIRLPARLGLDAGAVVAGANAQESEGGRAECSVVVLSDGDAG